MTSDAGKVAEILELLGEDVRILQPRREAGTRGEGGGDIDCAVRALDHLWPWRLVRPWRLCQRVHYDVGDSWYWALEREGDFLAVDTLDDEAGRGRLGFPTSLAFEHPGLLAVPAVRAAYLTTKRLAKRIDTRAEWRRIADLASLDPASFVSHLRSIFGSRCGERVAARVLSGGVPDASLRRLSRLGLWAMRLRRDIRNVGWPIAGASRVIERLRYQTGVCVLVVGPDGAGKSTLTDSLAISLAPLFRTTVRLHWRPDVLARPAAILGFDDGDTSQPHGRSSHGAVVSLCLLLYHWADFQVGHLLRVLPVRAKSGLVLWERGWWDIAVDPQRYRLRVPRGIVDLLGAILRKPDLVLVLEGSSDILARRKAELDRGELIRQTAAWRSALPTSMPAVYLDSDKELADVSAAAREAVLRYMQERAIARIGTGWTSIGGRRSIPVLVPRSPRSAAAGGLSIKHPVTLSDHVLSLGARTLSSAGLLRLAPRAPAGPNEVIREAVAPFLARGDSIAVATSRHPGRYVVSVLAHSGEPRIVAKVATDERGTRALADEARAIEQIGSLVRPPLAVPSILAHTHHALVLDAVRWRLRARPWLLPPAVAHGLGSLFATSARMTPEGLRGSRHGQCTPWNLLHAANGWYLVDWSMADDQGAPFFDVFHYLVLSHAFLPRPSRRQILDGLVGRGLVGATFRAYADGAKVSTDAVEEAFNAYLSDMARRLARVHQRKGSLARAMHGLTVDLRR